MSEQKTAQINYYAKGKNDPIILMVRSEFHDEAQAQRWLESLQQILKSHQRLHHDSCKEPTIRFLDSSVPQPRSKPPIIVPCGKMPDIDDLLEPALAA